MNRSKLINLTRLHRFLRTEGDKPVAKAMAIGLGTFIGFTPLYGLHLSLCLIVAHLLKLNKILTVLASNVNNPFIIPFVLYLEFGVGNLILKSQWPQITLTHFSGAGLIQTGFEILLGSLVVGTIAGLLLGYLTYLFTKDTELPHAQTQLLQITNDRYLESGIIKWEYVRWKLKNDPMYLDLLTKGYFRDSKRLWDLGCGRGIMLSLLATINNLDDRRGWEKRLPSTIKLNGLACTEKEARKACSSLVGDATIICGGVIDFTPDNADTYLLINVLSLLPEDDQARVIETLKNALPVNGKIIVREHNAGAGWCFYVAKIMNRLVSIFRGNLTRHFYYRSEINWIDLFRHGGFSVGVHKFSQKKSSCNQLFIITR